MWRRSQLNYVNENWKRTTNDQKYKNHTHTHLMCTYSHTIKIISHVFFQNNYFCMNHDDGRWKFMIFLNNTEKPMKLNLAGWIPEFHFLIKSLNLSSILSPEKCIKIYRIEFGGGGAGEGVHVFFFIRKWSIRKPGFCRPKK